MREFVFEGGLTRGEEKASAYSLSALQEALKNNTILEAVCYMCDKEQNLHIKLGEIEGIIPKNESAIGVQSGKVKDIALISKVGKPVQFTVSEVQTEQGKPVAYLSRKAVQEACRAEYIATLRAGDIIRAKVTHLERFGAFVDIGAGINSLIPIDMLSVSRISHPSQRVKEGEVLRCAVRSITDEKITLSLRELLGDWTQNAAHFEAGQTVKGIVRSVESYGVFIELTPNLAGLAEYSDAVHAGQTVSVYIKSILPEKMKIKLSIIDVLEDDAEIERVYYFKGRHMDYWRYSPADCTKLIETRFA